MRTPSSAQVLDAGTPTVDAVSDRSSGRHHRIDDIDDIDNPGHAADPTEDLGHMDHCSPVRSSTIRVGVDLVVVDDVARSVEHFGHRYLDRVFTEHELACCRAGDRPERPDRPQGLPGEYSFESLAARFAAKEATVKVLRPEGPRPEWRSIEVHRTGAGWCEIRLSGLAATMAAEAGIVEWSVSLTHESTLAAAVVIGTCGHGNRPDGRQAEPDWREEEPWTRPFDLS
jgi:holo-[acyl-carrier protein] synthase